jgi:hypothetical protein
MAGLSPIPTITIARASTASGGNVLPTLKICITYSATPRAAGRLSAIPLGIPISSAKNMELNTRIKVLLPEIDQIHLAGSDCIQTNTPNQERQYDGDRRSKQQARESAEVCIAVCLPVCMRYGNGGLRVVMPCSAG